MKPSPEEMQQAITVAKSMRDKGEDPDFLSRTLLYLQHRVVMLEKVFDATRQYIHFGQEEHDHARLVHALEIAREVEDKEKRQEKQDFGL